MKIDLLYQFSRIWKMQQGDSTFKTAASHVIFYLLENLQILSRSIHETQKDLLKIYRDKNSRLAKEIELSRLAKQIVIKKTLKKEIKKFGKDRSNLRKDAFRVVKKFIEKEQNN